MIWKLQLSKRILPNNFRLLNSEIGNDQKNVNLYVVLIVRFSFP